MEYQSQKCPQNKELKKQGKEIKEENQNNISIANHLERNENITYNSIQIAKMEQAKNSQIKQTSLANLKVNQQFPVVKSSKTGHHATKNDLFSGISFSRFQAISEPSQVQDFDCESKRKSSQPMMELNEVRPVLTCRIPTSTKIISSKKIIQDPVEITSYSKQELYVPQSFKSRGIIKQQYSFRYTNIQQCHLFQKIAKFGTARQMELNIGSNEIMISKRVPLYKLALRICFPSSLEHQIYKFTCVNQKIAKLTKLSGDDHKFKLFTEEFQLELWAKKQLQCTGLQQNLKFFIKYANSKLEPSNLRLKQLNAKEKGELDELKSMIQNALRLASLQKMRYEKNLSKPIKVVELLNEIIDVYSNGEILKVKQKLKQTQQMLKLMLQKTMGKQKQIKLDEDKQNKIQQDLVISPAVQRLMLSVFYHELQLGSKVHKYIISEKAYGDFEKKKMIIKGSLTSEDIFKYLQLSELYKLCNPTHSKSPLFPQALKILSSLKLSSYPCPSQIIQIASIFKNNLAKQVAMAVQNKNNPKVKLQDHSNDERTLLQIFIYAIIMCENKQIYDSVQTARVFYDNSQQQEKVFQQDSLKIINLLKKAILFVQNEWQL